jgi:hypothetical protein
MSHPTLTIPPQLMPTMWLIPTKSTPMSKVMTTTIKAPTAAIRVVTRAAIKAMAAIKAAMALMVATVDKETKGTKLP